MCKYYAFKPDDQGEEPMGTQNRLLFELKTDMGAIRRAGRVLGQTAKVFRYTDFYDGSTFQRVRPAFCL